MLNRHHRRRRLRIAVAFNVGNDERYRHRISGKARELVAFVARITQQAVLICVDCQQLLRRKQIRMRRVGIGIRAVAARALHQARQVITLRLQRGLRIVSRHRQNARRNVRHAQRRVDVHRQYQSAVRLRARSVVGVRGYVQRARADCQRRDFVVDNRRRAVVRAENGRRQRAADSAAVGKRCHRRRRPRLPSCNNVMRRYQNRGRVDNGYHHFAKFRHSAVNCHPRDDSHHARRGSHRCDNRHRAVA